jgi:hypothetical protein
LKIRNFGEKSLGELREKLAERGVGSPSSLAGTPSDLSDFAISSAEGTDLDVDTEEDDGEVRDVEAVARLLTSEGGLMEAFGGVTIEAGTPEAEEEIKEDSDLADDDEEAD